MDVGLSGSTEPKRKEEFRDRQIACRRHAYECVVDSFEIYVWTWTCDKSEVRG